jgi:hypothetical protein
VIEPTPEYVNRLSIFILIELPYFAVNYVKNRSGCSQYTNLSEYSFFKLFFSDVMVEILSKKTNINVAFQQQNPPPSFYAARP